MSGKLTAGVLCRLLRFKPVVFLLEQLQHAQEVLSAASLGIELRQPISAATDTAEMKIVVVVLWVVRVLQLPEALISA